MRIPNIISENTFKTYQLNKHDSITIKRRLKSDDYSWDEKLIKTLRYICLETIKNNWKDYPLYNELKYEIDRQILSEILSCDLPLSLTVPIIDDDFYWRRRYQYLWPNTSRPIMYIKNIEQFYHSTLPPVDKEIQDDGSLQKDLDDNNLDDQLNNLDDQVNNLDDQVNNLDDQVNNLDDQLDGKNLVKNNKGKRFFKKVNSLIKTVNNLDKKCITKNKNNLDNLSENVDNGNDLNNNNAKNSNGNDSSKNSIKSSKTSQNSPKLPKTSPNSPKLSKTSPNSPKLSKTSPNSPKLSKTSQHSTPKLSQSSSPKLSPKLSKTSEGSSPKLSKPSPNSPKASKPLQNSPNVSKTSLESSKPSPNSPNSSKPSPNSPKSSKPSPNSPKLSKPSPDAPKVSKSSPDSPKVSKPSSDSPKVSKPSPNSPKSSKPSQNSLKLSKPSPDAPKVSKSSPDSPKVSKPSSDSPKVSKPSPNSPRVSKPSPSSPKVSKPSQNSLKVSKPLPDSPKSSKPSPSSPKSSKPSPESPKSSKESPDPQKVSEPSLSGKSSENTSKLSSKQESKSSIKMEASPGLLRKNSEVPRKLSIPSRKASISGVDDVKKFEDEDGHFMEVPLVKSWKICYLEKYFQEMLQDLEPTKFNQEVIRELIEIIEDYVYSLRLKSLKSAVPSDEVPLQSNDHIPLDMIVGSLPNLFELTICFNEMGLADNFTWEKTSISDRDCKLLGQGLEKSDLKIFRILKSNINARKLELFLGPLLKNTNLKILDLSHCVIGDDGVEAITSGMKQYPGIESLILVNNKIGVEGAEYLSEYLRELRTKPGLVNLNIKLNEIKDEGCNHLADALIKGGSTLKSIGLAGCGLAGKANKFINMLNKNNTLEKIDLSNNNLGTKFADKIIDGITKNKRVIHIDLRMCNIPPDRRAKIDLILYENWVKRRGQISRPVVIFEMPYSML